MARYVDGYVLPIKKSKVKDYKKAASIAGKIWMKCGALSYVECAGDDLSPDMGEKLVKFPGLAKAKKDETVIFSFITYKSRAHRDKVNAKVMKEMQKSGQDNKDMPFDMHRMAFGGFKAIVDL